MEDMNLLIESNKDLSDLVTDTTNILNDKNSITDSLALSGLDENSSTSMNNAALVTCPALVENLNLNNHDENTESNDNDEYHNKENEPVEKTANGVEFQAQINKPCQFALARIKTVMKLDPDLNLMSKESVFLIAKATVNLTFFFYLVFKTTS